MMATRTACVPRRILRPDVDILAYVNGSVKNYRRRGEVW